MDESDSVFQACNLMLTDRETQFQSCLKTSETKERVLSTVDTDHSGLKLPPWGILKKKLEMLNLARRGNFFSAAPNLNFWVNFGKYVTE